MSIKIAITYEKGGCAKTTTAVNVSAILAERGFRVLLVDLDHQAYATSYFGLYDDSLPGIYEVMQDQVSVAEAIRPTGVEKLDLLPSVYRFKDMETALMMKVRSQEYTLKRVLEPLEETYDFVLLDCPPGGDRVKTNALAYAGYAILPTIPDDYAVHGLLCMAEEVVGIRQDVNPALEVMGVLLTIDERTVNKMAYKEALQKQEIFPCFHTTIRKNTTLSEAINAHQPINVYNRRCTGFADYSALTDEILEKAEPGSAFGKGN